MIVEDSIHEHLGETQDNFILLIRILVKNTSVNTKKNKPISDAQRNFLVWWSSEL